MTTDEDKRLKSLLRHIDNVRSNCLKLGDHLIGDGEEQLGVKLIANGYSHDNSKFTGIEWLYLNDETKLSHPDLFKSAYLQHVSTNKHHPEAWIGGICSMDRLHHAEMICDWAARSSEFGTDLREYLKDKVTKKYNITTRSKAYHQMKTLIDMLLDTPFK